MRLATDAALAGGWFETRIDYWGDGPREVVAADEVAVEASGDEEAFDWAQYEDPREETFWEDVGDFRPPAPMMEVVRNPTPETVARYRQWVQAKLAVASEVARLVAEPAPAEVSWEGVDVVYIYASSCPHCQRNVGVVLELVRRGANVLPVHLDRPSEVLPGSVPWTSAMGELVALQGTPTFVLRAPDGGREVVRGFATLARLEGALRGLVEESWRR